MADKICLTPSPQEPPSVKWGNMLRYMIGCCRSWQGEMRGPSRREW
jgi:hypothetical protein